MFDSPIDRHRRTKKSLLPFWLLIVTILIVFGYCLYATVGPNPPIIVSKATTHLTAPLGKDGLPDYAAVLLADTMKGVTPETNAAVPLLELLAFGDHYDFKSSERDNLKQLLDSIGAKWLPDKSIASPYGAGYRIKAARLYRERVPRPDGIRDAGAIDLADSENTDSVEASAEIEFIPDGEDAFWTMTEEEAAADDRVSYYEERMHDRPWSRNDLPFLADYFDENASSFDHLVAGLERSAWGLPRSGWLRGERDPNTWYDMSTEGAIRHAAHLLQARTLYLIGNKDWKAARRNGLAILTLAAHAANGQCFTEQLLSLVIDGIGLQTIRQIALAPEIPANELRALLQEFEAIGPAGQLGAVVGRGERFIALSEIITSANHPNLSERFSDYRMVMLFAKPDRSSAFDPQMLSNLKIDWNVVLRRFNSIFDRAAVAAKISNTHSRRKALRLIDAEIESANAEIKQRAKNWYWTPALRGELVADFLLSASLTPFEGVFAMEDRTKISHELVRSVIAVAIHRAEHGEYPESLTDLVPDVFAKAPTDPVHGGSLAYRRTEDGFLVYSLGMNGADDGGSNDGLSFTLRGPIFEGVVIDDMNDPTEAANLSAQIPDGADDIPFRAPRAIKSWPWEKPPGDSPPPASVESSPGD